MPTIQALYGAEHGSPAGLLTGPAGGKIFDVGAGTPGTDIQVLATAARPGSGTYGLRISNQNHYVGWDTNTLGASRSVLVVSFWFRVSTQTSGETEVLVWDLAGGGVDHSSLDYIPETGVLRAYVCGTTVDAATTFTVGAWHHIDLRYTITTATHSFSWAIDGAAQPGVPGATGNTADTFTLLAFGQETSNTTGAMDYDDILVSVTPADYPIGRHKVMKLGVDPAGTVVLSGTATNFRTFFGLTPTLETWDATVARDRTKEIPPNVSSAQDGWAQVTTAATEYVATPLTTYTLASAESVVAARLLACLWGPAPGAGYIEFHTHNGTTERVLYGGTPGATNSATPTWLCRMLLAPATDLATQAQIDALVVRAGYANPAGTGIGLHAMYVELAVKEGTVVLPPAAVAAFAAVPVARPKLLPSRTGAVTVIPVVHPSQLPSRVVAVVAIPSVRPVTLPSNTEEFWSIDGVSLHQFGWSVATVGGSRYDVPTRRGENMTLAYRPGTFHRAKVVESRTIALIMWLTGAHAATGAAVSNPTVQWNDSWDFLRRLVFKPDGGRVTLVRRCLLNAASPTLLIAEAEAELVDTLSPKMTGRTRADFTISLLLADPYFYGPLVTVNVNQGTPVSVTNPGHDSAGHNNMEVDLIGPLTNPRLTNTTCNVWVQFAGVIAAGQVLRLSIPNFTALRINDGENLIGGISHSGARLWMALLAGGNQLTLTATAGTGTAQLRYQPPYI